MGEFADLKVFLSGLNRKAQFAEIRAAYAALHALAKNTGRSEVSQYMVNLIREVPMEDKKLLLSYVSGLPPFPDATVLLELVDHNVPGYTALGGLAATTDPRAEPVARETLLAEKNEFAAAQVLRKLATAESASTLVQVITSTKDNFVGRACLGALRHADGPGYVTPKVRTTCRGDVHRQQ